MEQVQGMIDKIKAMEEQPKPQAEEKKAEPQKSDKTFMQKLRSGEITTADIPEGICQEWIRSVLGGVPFAYSVPLLGGKVRITFGELDKEAAAIHRELTNVLGDDIDRQTKLCIVLFLREVSGEVNVKFDGKKSLEDPNIKMFASGKVDKTYEEICDKLPVGLSRMLAGAWTIYSTLVATLMQNAFPDSF